MKLIKIEIKNFKGIKQANMPFDGENAVISAENGSGKTSVYDAFLWLLFGKNSSGKSDFDVRPYDNNNIVQKDVEIYVGAEVKYYDQIYLLEKVNKKTKAGYSNSFKINEVPKKAGEFNEFVSTIADEEVFKLCSNLTYFNELHWTKRREMLLTLAGDISKPEGFETLLAEAGNRTLDEYKKVVKDRLKMMDEERKGIGPRIDELTLSINEESISDGLMTFEQEREQLQSELAELDERYAEIEQHNVQRARTIEEVSKLRNKQIELQTSIQSDKSHVADISEQIAGKRQAISAMITGLKDIEEKGKQLAMAEKSKRQELNDATGRINKLRLQRDELKKEIEELHLEPVENTCYACGQLLPQGKFQENIDAKKRKEYAKQQEYDKVVTEGKALKATIDKLTAELATMSQECQAARDEYKDQQSLYNDVKAKADAEIKALEGQIAEAGTPDYTQNQDWITLDKQIKAIQIPDIKTTAELAKQRQEIQTQLDGCNKALAQSDTIEKNKKRIKELQEQEVTLGIEIAKLEGVVAQIAEYHKQESEMICNAVNGQFKHVTFNMFNTLINGNTEPCCDTIYNGVPYAGCSTGEKIIVGIDIVNRLSSWYNVNIPLFIDNSESLTIPYDCEMQTIELRVSNNKKLKMEIKK